MPDPAHQWNLNQELSDSKWMCLPTVPPFPKEWLHWKYAANFLNRIILPNLKKKDVVSQSDRA